MESPWGECAISDAHVHFFTRRFFASLGASCRKSAEETAAAAGWELPPDDAVEFARLWAAELDRYGVARAALIASVPGDEASVITAAAAFPGRFYAYAMINPTAPNADIARGLHAVCLFPAMHAYSLDDPRVQSLFEQAAAQRCAVFVHCGVLTVGVRKKLGLPSPFDLRFSNPIALHASALRYPNVRFILPHFGAGYFREALMLADLCPNVYLDTSSGNSWMRYEGLDLETVFRRALQVAGAARLLFGTDSSFFPRGWNREVYAAQTRALANLGIASGDARSILGENLDRILAES